MKVFVHVLQSGTSGAYYVGTSADPDKRLTEHNRGQTRSTRHGVPWCKVWCKPHPNRASAMAREREIKAWKSRSRIEELVATKNL
ncbi:MAG: GIY-YIG nuclease family protein [Fimbriimonadaceae bacterium]|nr:GIY-YIG nuclease family protein [Fimbriimonadaceae bacterium]